MERAFVALLPMKGHSERIPDKNLRPIAGKPLCFWVLETLQQVPEITQVAINTDSQEIARRCSEYFDVSIHERPEAICGDQVSMNRIIEHDLSLLNGRDCFIQTHATNPLVTPSTLREALALYTNSLDRYDSVFSVTRYQSRFYDASGNPINHAPDELIRTQDLPPVYEENSCFYIFSRSGFGKVGRRIGTLPTMFEINPLEAIDIDDEGDWILAEGILERRLSSHAENSD